LSTVPEVVLKGPFTFISPSVYVAHRQMSVDGVFHDLTRSRTSYPAGLLTFLPDEIHSVVYRWTPLRSTNKSARAEGIYPSRSALDIKTLPFNYANLENPVPARVYAEGMKSEGFIDDYATITDDSYRPRLIFNTAPWANNGYPELSGCANPDFVDPPIALRPVYTIKVPVITAFASKSEPFRADATRAAQPSIQPAAPWAAQTSVTYPTDPGMAHLPGWKDRPHRSFPHSASTTQGGGNGAIVPDNEHKVSGRVLNFGQSSHDGSHGDLVVATGGGWRLTPSGFILLLSGALLSLPMWKLI